jgi:hypothetical protein
MFLPVNRPWPNPVNSDDAQWYLTGYSGHANSWRLLKGNSTLVNVDSQTARTISGILSLVEHSMHVHMLLEDAS